jgi:demethylspheroidene O-methyltransferase
MVTPERRSGAGLLLETLEGPIRYALLDWALTSGIFNLCQTAMTPEVLGTRMGLPPASLALALKALVAAGFMHSDGSGYHTAPDILPFVTEGSARNMQETLRSMAQTRHAHLDRFGDLVSGINVAQGTRLFDDAHWDANHRSLAAFHEAIAADAMEPCLTGLPEWEKARNLLEVGAGSAVLAKRLLTKRADIDITLFDLPPVAKRIQDEVQGLPVSVIPGNYNNDLPAGSFDIIWCSMTLYFHQQNLTSLIRRLSDLLAPNGVLVSFHEALTDDRTGPPEHVLGRLIPALRQGDVSFADGEIAAAMADAGLLHPTTETVSTPFGRFRLDAARKEA